MAFALGLAALTGCKDRSTAKPAMMSAASLPPPAVVEHPATIAGKVTFAGAAPKLSPIVVSGVPQCAGMHPDGVPDESVVIGDGGALANVFVYLKDAPASNGSGSEAEVLDQTACRYVPHAVGVQIGQALRVKNSDAFLHNVHVKCDLNPAENWAENGITERTVRFNVPERIPVQCDVHPWMKAWVVAFENPYYAVSRPDGSFEIKGVPAGTYTLAAWHERFGELSQRVTVAADGKVNADFAYKP